MFAVVCVTISLVFPFYPVLESGKSQGILIEDERDQKSSCNKIGKMNDKQDERKNVLINDKNPS